MVSAQVRHKLVEYVQDDRIVYEANPDYWIDGVPCIANLTLKVCPTSRLGFQICDRVRSMPAPLRRMLLLRWKGKKGLRCKADSTLRRGSSR